MLLVTVNVTVAVPPQALGGAVLLLVKTALQPPVKVAMAIQALYLAVISACVWQAVSILSVGQVKLTSGAVSTVNVRVQLTTVWQSLVTVKVTVTDPPVASGAPVLLLVKTALHPLVTVAVANQAAYLALISACVWQKVSVTFTGQFKLTVGAVVTLKVLVQVTGAWQSLVTVKVTEVEPPQAGGAPALLLVKTALHPPLAVAVASQVLYLALISACVWHGASIVLVGQFKLTTGAAVTVKVRVQVTGGWQSLVTVKVTVEVPPQAAGAPVLLLVRTALQPPVDEAVASQVAYFVSISACVWQAASVTLEGQVSTTEFAFTVNVRVQVIGG